MVPTGGKSPAGRKKGRGNERRADRAAETGQTIGLKVTETLGPLEGHPAVSLSLRAGVLWRQRARPRRLQLPGSTFDMNTIVTRPSAPA
jgi:hypothetical protein